MLLSNCRIPYVGTLITLPDGNIGKLEMFRDITEIKQTENKRHADRSAKILDNPKFLASIFSGLFYRFNCR